RLRDWTVDYSLGHSTAGEEGAISEIGGAFIAEDVDIGYDATDSERPTLFGFGDQAILDPTAFALDEAESEDVFNEERETAITLNFRRDMEFGDHSGYVKFGAKSRFREKENDTELTLYEGFGDDYTLNDFLDTGMDYPLPGNLGPGVDFSRFRDFVETNSSSFEINEADSLIDSRAEDYDLEENIHAAYVMASADIGNLNMVGGLRAEYTDYEAVGTRVSIDEQTNDGNPVLDSFSGSKSYTDLFPSLALRHQLSERTQWRAAATRTISRPGFEDASPRQALEISGSEEEGFEREAEIGNPDLEPLLSNNLDFRWEHYPTGVSSVSAGAFYKDIDNFFITADVAGQAPFENFDEVIQTLNGGSASLFGIELEYYQQLDWLPTPFNSLLVGANYTYSDSEAELPGRAQKSRLPGQSDHIGNLSFGYDDGRISARLATTFRSEFFEEVEDIEDPSGDRYQYNHMQVDFTGKFRVNDSLELYLNMINLNDEPLHAYFGEPRFVSQLETYGRTYEAGFTLQF
ncbi:MAG: TonB-dependent receptor domain-containing protein, partial [Pseudomonadota bacterium]